MIRGLRHVHIHFAGLFTPAAVDAFVLIHLHPRQRYPVEQRVERAQRAQPLAERPVEQHAQDDHRRQHHALPREQVAQGAPNAFAGQGKGNRPLQHALGAQVLAEEGIAQPHLVDEDQRQRHRQQQNQVLEIGQGLELLGGRLLLRKWNLVQQLLKPAEGAQEAAHEPPQQNAQQDQRTGNVVGKPKLGRSDHRLNRPNGARSRSGGAGVAVEPRHADVLAFSPVNLPLEQVGQMGVGQKRGAGLQQSPKPGEKAGNGRSLWLCLLLIQCLHTPDRF